MALQFRPHHFLCTLGYEGKGYSAGFVAGYDGIARGLKAPGGDDALIEVTASADSICAPCPNRRGDGCESQAKIDALDSAHAGILGVRPGEKLTWREAKERIAARMTPELHRQACAPCSWRGLGVCEAALVRLRSTTREPLGSTIAGALALAVLFLGAGPAQAAGPTSKPSPQANQAPREKASGKKGPPKVAVVPIEKRLQPAEPEPIDQVTEALFREERSQRTRGIGKAIRALRSGNGSLARELALPYRNDELFADYGHWIPAQAWKAEAERALERRRPELAVRAAERAIDLFLALERQFPESAWIPRLTEEMAASELIVAEGQFARRAWTPAQKAYERGFNRYGLLGNHRQIAQLRPETLDRYADTCQRSPTDLCASWIQRFVQLLPKTSPEARALLKRFPDVFEKFKAPASPAKLVQTYRGTELDQSAFEAAMVSYNEENYDTAARALRQFRDEYPRSSLKHRARFWLAQSLTQEQEHEEATRLYDAIAQDGPLTYYGLLSALMTGRAIDTEVAGTLPMATRSDPFLSPSELLRLKRAERFVAEGVSDLGRQEIGGLRPRDSLSSPFLLYAATVSHEAGDHRGAFQILGELINRSYPGVYSSHGLRLIFPVVQYETIRKHAAKEKLDPVLVLSLVKQESAFDVHAVSGSGAAGLMQLMPATAVDTDPEVKRADLGDPEINVRIGSRYLRKVLDKFDGNLALALAGYNAGPHNVDKWLREGRAKKGLLDFVELIPFRETREYVAGIIRNYYWYSRRLTGEIPKSLDFFWGEKPSTQGVPAPTGDS